MSLERRYGLLLRAYPRRYRRTRGAEILTTLLDGAAPGQTWPHWRDAADLVRGGLRYRIMPPRGAGYLVAAGLSAVLLGVIVAALSATLTWRSVESGDDRRALDGFLAQTGAVGSATSVERLYTVGAWQPESYQQVNVLFDGGRGAGMGDVDRRLTAAGWRVHRLVLGNDVTDSLIADRDGDSVELTFLRDPNGATTTLIVDYDHRVPGRVWQGLLGGLLAGAAAGWLLAAWFLRGIREHRGAGARAGLLVTGLTMLGLELVVLLTMASYLYGGLDGRLTSARLLAMPGYALADSGIWLLLIVGAAVAAATVSRASSDPPQQGEEHRVGTVPVRPELRGGSGAQPG